jgi:hypothetical protein
MLFSCLVEHLWIPGLERKWSYLSVDRDTVLPDLRVEARYLERRQRRTATINACDSNMFHVPRTRQSFAASRREFARWRR